MSEEPILAVKNMHIHYHLWDRTIRAVDGVSFEVKKDEIFGLVGESGSGKTTLCMGILCMVSPPGKFEDGEVVFAGTDLLAMEKRQLRKIRWKQLAYIPQGSMAALNPVIKVREQFYDVVWDHEGFQSRKSLDEYIVELLTKVHLDHSVLNKYPHELSGGMRQRACIALAMLLKPTLLIADEPTSALDVVSQRAVLETLAEARQSLKASVVFVGHDMALQAQLTDRMGIMYGGKFVEIGDTKEIFNNPVHAYTQRLISSIPSIHKKQDIRELAVAGFDGTGQPTYKITPELTEVRPGHFVAI